MLVPTTSHPAHRRVPSQLHVAMRILAYGAKLALPCGHEVLAQGPLVVGVQCCQVHLHVPALSVAMCKATTLPKLTTFALHELLAEHSFVLWTCHLWCSSSPICTSQFVGAMGKHAFSSVRAEALSPLGAENCFVLATTACPGAWSSSKLFRATSTSKILPTMSPFALLPPLAHATRLPVFAQHSLVLLTFRPLFALPMRKEASSSIWTVPRLSPGLAESGLVGGALLARRTLWSNDRGSTSTSIGNAVSSQFTFSVGKLTSRSIGALSSSPVSTKG